MRPFSSAFALLLTLAIAFAADRARAQVDDADRVGDPADVADPVDGEVEDAPAAEPEPEPPRRPRDLLESAVPPAIPFTEDAVEDPAARPAGAQPLDPADRGLDPADVDPLEMDPVELPTGARERRAERAGFACPAGAEQKELGHERVCVDGEGRRHGPWERRHPSGALAAQGEFARGLRHGVFTTWFPSGQLEARTVYVEGREHGVQELWYASGQKKAETEVRGGRAEGRQTLWYESGQKQAEGGYRAGERHGTWFWYAEDGRIVRTADYDAGASATPPVPAPKGPEPDRTPAALAGAIGAGAGVLVGVPVTLAILRMRVFASVDPQGWLVSLVLPPLAVALGSSLALVWFTPLPAAGLAGATAGLAVPVGGLAGVVLGLVAGGLLGGLADVVLRTGGSLFGAVAMGGALIGGLGGALLSPVAVASGVGWFFAEAEPADVE